MRALVATKYTATDINLLSTNSIQQVFMLEGIVDMVQVFARCLLTHQLRKHRVDLTRDTYTKRQATPARLPAQLAGRWRQRNWKSIRWAKKYFVLGQVRTKISCTGKRRQKNHSFTSVSTVSCCQPGAENIEWYIEDQDSCVRMIWLFAHTLPLRLLSVSSAGDTPIYWERETTCWRGRARGGGGRGANSYDSKEVWSSMNHSILSGLEHPALANRERTVCLFHSLLAFCFQFVIVN